MGYDGGGRLSCHAATNRHHCATDDATIQPACTFILLFAGVASWKWFYPYHFAPFASSLRGLDEYGPIVFDLGEQ